MGDAIVVENIFYTILKDIKMICSLMGWMMASKSHK